MSFNFLSGMRVKVTVLTGVNSSTEASISLESTETPDFIFLLKTDALWKEAKTVSGDTPG